MVRLAFALVFVAAPAFAQAPLEGKTILAVHVSGLDHIKESVVLAQIESVPGSRTTAPRPIATSSGWTGSASSARSR